MSPRAVGAVLALALALALAALAVPALAQTERILSFASEVTVRPDGVLHVEETIDVVAAGEQIRRGIFRDFPTRSLTPWGFNRLAGFEVVRVERDGRLEPWFTSELAAGIRVYIGDRDVSLPPGRHRYVIAYDTSRQLLHRPGEDELYWNVTGDAWAFPIDRATVTVRLPEGAESTALAAYTGPRGARGSDFRVLKGEGREVRLAATRTLAPGEGLTVAVAWPDGAVARPGPGAERMAFAADNPGILAGLALSLAAAGYFAWAWHRVGRDPARGTVIPLFEAPDGLSPVQAGHVWSGGFTGDFGVGRALTVTITSLATRGALTIEDIGDGAFRLSARPVGDGRLSGEEVAVYRALFADEADTIEFGSDYVPTLGIASGAMQQALAGFGAAYLRLNGAVWTLGALIAVAAVLAGLLIDAMGEEVLVPIAALGAFGAAFGAVGLGMAARAVSGLLDPARRGGLRPLRRLGWLLAAAACLAAVAGVAWILSEMVAPAALLVPAIAIPASVAAAHLLRAPTALGRRTLDALEGYRLYLSVAESDRLNAAGREPEVTAALFERHLPYAMALGVEQEWSEKVAARLAGSLDDPSRRRGFEPAWYRSASGRGMSMPALAGALSGGLGGAAAHASTRPTSSGGSSGGGSSGGGGGGGGGGGW